ncbi:MAG: Hpt domain-containing protein [Aliidiomarina sp.]|uniref:Hpt domain-containing protein n=1 Tax=Aliidiomarina sp. TaxID=1872439 RepID=UPI0025BAED7D|nr:Hpt domain-containing protein [Aliidiomarina sp.]MCH8501355.1 Hpt domain-containing protein [Aliidiomarina sp.]
MSSANKSAIDWDLIGQYRSLLGATGLADSVAMLQRVMPQYIDELQTHVASQNEKATRAQAHKMKGSCRSLGLNRVGLVMEWLEKESWQWSDVEETLATWPALFEQDCKALVSGL